MVPPQTFSRAELDAFDDRPHVLGREWRYLCPVCGHEKPRDNAHRSLSVNSENGLYKCHRCDCKGRLKEYREETKSGDSGASRPLYGARARRARLSSLDTAPPPPEHDDWRAYLGELQPLAATPGATYLERRGIPPDVATLAGVQFHPHFYGRPAVIFPICDRTGATVALSGRYLANRQPKTRVAGPKREGAFFAPSPRQTVDARSGRGVFHPLDSSAPAIIVTEAPIDALSLAVAGFPAIACIGTTAPGWLHLACGLRRVLLAFDADPAGDSASDKLMESLAPYTQQVERLRPEQGKDWNEILLTIGRDKLADWLAVRVLGYGVL